MPPPSNYRRRRPGAQINKNELKVTRNENEKKNRASVGTLQTRFPGVQAVQIAMRMEAPTGAVLEESNRTLKPDDSLWVDVPCLGGCSGGIFLLTEAIEAMLGTGQTEKEGMALCQSSSFRDPSLPCSTKFYYRLSIER